MPPMTQIQGDQIVALLRDIRQLLHDLNEATTGHFEPAEIVEEGE